MNHGIEQTKKWNKVWKFDGKCEIAFYSLIYTPKNLLVFFLRDSCWITQDKGQKISAQSLNFFKHQFIK